MLFSPQFLGSHHTILSAIDNATSSSDRTLFNVNPIITIITMLGDYDLANIVNSRSSMT